MSIEKVGPKDYMPALDGLRGFACMLVIVSHVCAILKLDYMPVNYVLGSSGVLLFFALSGFLMGSLYLRKEFALDSAGKYMVARFSRIAPAYYIAITCVLILPLIVTNSSYAMDVIMAIRSYAFMGSHEVFWSIPPEVQFYGYFLLIWAAYDRARQGKFLLMSFTLVLSIGLVISRELWGGILLPSKLHIFLCGVLASIVLHYPRVRSIFCHPAVQVAMIILSLAYISLFVMRGTIYNDIILAAIIALMVMSLSTSTKVTAIFETTTMKVMGAASFSIYLFHDMILHTMKDLGVFKDMDLYMAIFLCSVVAVAIPVAFHYLAERHLNKAAREKGMNIFEKIKPRFPALLKGRRAV